MASPWQRAERLVQRIRADPRLLLPLLALNAWGIAYGFYFYRFQLPETPWYLLPAVPDSPLAVILISVALAAWRWGGHRWDLLDALALGANVKIGAWTVFVLVFHRATYYTAFPWAPPVQFLLLVGHLGMMLEALLLVPLLARGLAARPPLYHLGLWLVPFALFLLNDALDYLRGQHPPIPSRDIEVVGWVSVGLTFASLLAGIGAVYAAQRLLGSRRAANA